MNPRAKDFVPMNPRAKPFVPMNPFAKSFVPRTQNSLDMIRIAFLAQIFEIFNNNWKECQRCASPREPDHFDYTD